MQKIGLSQTQTSAVSEHANKSGVIFCSGMIIERGAYRQQVMLLDVLSAINNIVCDCKAWHKQKRVPGVFIPFKNSCSPSRLFIRPHKHRKKIVAFKK